MKTHDNIDCGLHPRTNGKQKQETAKEIEIEKSDQRDSAQARENQSPVDPHAGEHWGRIHPVCSKFQMKFPEQYRELGRLGESGLFRIPIGGAPKPNPMVYRMIASNGGGWDHVSISIEGRNRCPIWQEMCIMKDLFFEADETVIQFHPKKTSYVNNHPFVLHLWKKQGQEYDLPPKEFV